MRQPLAALAFALDPFPFAARESTLTPRGPCVERLDPVVKSEADALRVALAALRLKPEDITFDPETPPSGPYRRSIVSRILKNPHRLEPEVLEVADRLTRAGAD